MTSAYIQSCCSDELIKFCMLSVKRIQVHFFQLKLIFCHNLYFFVFENKILYFIYMHICFLKNSLHYSLKSGVFYILFYYFSNCNIYHHFSGMLVHLTMGSLLFKSIHEYRFLKNIKVIYIYILLL